MKSTIVIALASAAIVGGILITRNSSTMHQDLASLNFKPGTPHEEGSGLNPNSRKYYQYLRQRNPETGIVERDIKSRSVQFASRLPKNNNRDVNWTGRGPFNKGGRTRAFALDITNENILMAGAVTGGMWRSEDGGQSWEITTAPLQLHSASCVVQDKRPGHEDEWYYGTGEEFYGVVSGTSFTSLLSGDGIFRSDDSGQTWEQLESTASATPEEILVSGSYDYIWNMVLDHTDIVNDVIYAAVYNGIIRSEDAGDTWEQVLGFDAGGSVFTDVMITPLGVLYATLSFSNGGNPGGIFRSVNGTDWTDISPDEFNYQRRTVMCFNPQNENEVYFLSEMNNTENFLGHTIYKYTYISDDGNGTGGNWENRSENLPDETCELDLGSPFEFRTFRSQNSYDLCIAHHPTDDVLFIGGTNVHRAPDAFATDLNDWIGGYRCNVDDPKDYNYPNHHSDEHGFLFLPSNPDVMYNFNDGGVYRTDDCMADSVQWEVLNNGYVTTQFYTTHLEQGLSESDFVFGGMQDNGTWLTHSEDETGAWKEVHADDGAFGALPFGREFIITSSQLGRMYKKEIDAEGILTNTARIDPQVGPSALFINPLILDPWSSNDLYIAGNKTIWWMPNVSDIVVNDNYYDALDNDYWDNLGESIIPASAGSISCLDKAYSNTNIIFYGSTAGRMWRLDDCFGETPVRTEITGDNFPESAWLSCVTMNDLDPNEAICSFSNYSIPSIFHTSDNGTSWVDVSGNLEENTDGSGAGPGVYWVEIYPSDPPVYFAATSAGLFSTELLDGESTVWQMEGDNTIGNVVVNMVTARPFDGTIAVGTHGNGIYSGSLTPVDAVRIAQSTNPIATVSAFPNPFTTEVEFNFTLASATHVQLEIFDVAGNKIDEIISSQLPAGKNSRKWKPEAALPKGTYLWRMQLGDKVENGKVVRK